MMSKKDPLFHIVLLILRLTHVILQSTGQAVKNNQLFE